MIFLPTERKGQFKNNSGFIIDFNPFLGHAYYFETDPTRNIQIKKFLHTFKGNFVLEHWNKPAKTIGLWDFKTNQYILPKLEEVRQPIQQTGLRAEFFPKKESQKPSYCIVYLYSILTKKNNLWTIEKG